MYTYKSLREIIPKINDYRFKYFKKWWVNQTQRIHQAAKPFKGIKGFFLPVVHESVEHLGLIRQMDHPGILFQNHFQHLARLPVVSVDARGVRAADAMPAPGSGGPASRRGIT